MMLFNKSDHYGVIVQFNTVLVDRKTMRAVYIYMSVCYINHSLLYESEQQRSNVLYVTVPGPNDPDRQNKWLWRTMSVAFMTR